MALIYRVRMNDGRAGRTDGTDIWIDDRLNPVQEKCTILHEQIHIERGHGTLQPEAIEMSVRYETARRLLPIDSGQWCQGDSIKEVAANLGVTRQVLMDRAATLTEAQAANLGCFSCQLCPAQAARFQSFTDERTSVYASGQLPARPARFKVAP